MHKVVTIGTFDVPHIGHVMFLSKVMNLAGGPEHVLVGVNSDDFAGTFKSRPLYTESERLTAISALGFSTTINDGPGLDLIKQVRPELVVIGSDWLERDYLRQIGATQEDMRRLGFSIVFVPYSSIVSTTDIKARMAR